MGVEFTKDFSQAPLDVQLKKQYDRLVSLFGFVPSVFNVHYAHGKFNPLLIEAAEKFAEKTSTPIINMSNDLENFHFRVKQTTVPYFMPLRKNFSEIKKFVDSMKDNQSYEILMHPGRYDPNCKSSLNKERENELKNTFKLTEYTKLRPNVVISSYYDL